MIKLSARDRAQLVVAAYESGLVVACPPRLSRTAVNRVACLPMITASQFTLLPCPRQFDIEGPGCPLSTEVTMRVDDSLPAEGFQFTVTTEGAVLSHRDAAGARYGGALVAQLRDQIEDSWPGLVIRDWPDYPVRGYMLDVSRGRVPTRETLERLVALLVVLRVNHLQLYTEHTFAYSSHETVWRDASPLTSADITWLDALCNEHGIELAANQNCFGHMENWLKHDAYRHRAEKPEGFEMLGRHRDATTLAPTRDNAVFALELVAELLPHFTSRRINIGCDETWELGKGVSATEAAERGVGAVYADHVRRLAEPLLLEGYDVQFWGDVIAHYPELVSRLPEGACAVAWDYQAPWPADKRERFLAALDEKVLADLDMESKIDGFASTVAPFVRAGYPFWVAPGTSTWRSLIGRLDNAYGNLEDTISVGLDSGAKGVLITDWGDAGHLQPPSVSFPPLAYGAALAWCRDTNRGLDVPGVLDRFVFGGQGLGAVLDRLGRQAEACGQIVFNASPLQLALEDRAAITAGEPDPALLADVVDELNAVLEAIEAASGAAPDLETIKEELSAATRLARHGAWRMLSRAGAPAPGPDALRRDLDDAIERHRAAWGRRSRPGGIEIGLSTLIQLRDLRT